MEIQQQEQTIAVVDKNGEYLSHCTKRRAKQLVKRKAAEWVALDMVRLLYDKADKRRFRQEAIERDKYTCYICKKVMHKRHPELSVDHILAKNKGGSDYPDNLACCCKTCNEEKANMDLATYLKIYREKQRERSVM